MIDVDYIFVYGTLRKNFRLKLKDRVTKDLEYVGSAKVEASLYDLGRYPGAVKENGGDEVVGDVFRVTNAAKVFKVLDEYEGERFSREKEDVRLRGGASLNAWVYWYNQPPDAHRKIKYKDYLNYLKHKKTA